jgi:menaquinol-cytochrome c reductase cytochrome b/c subunit
MLLPPLALLACAAALVAGCGGEDSRGAVNTPPGELPDGDSRGARIVSGAGCLACHRLAGQGQDGPGPDLSDVGARLDPPAIRAVLRYPKPPMPDYRSLPPVDLDALVDYLAALR